MGNLYQLVIVKFCSMIPYNPNLFTSLSTLNSFIKEAISFGGY
jgi:hypothetical protein